MQLSAEIPFEEFRRVGHGLKPGQALGMTHDTYGLFFPPGEPDEGARETCYKFAKSVGCRIDNRPALKEIWLIKNAKATGG